MRTTNFATLLDIESYLSTNAAHMLLSLLDVSSSFQDSDAGARDIMEAKFLMVARDPKNVS